MTLSRRHFGASCLAAACLAAPFATLAQPAPWPSKPLRIVVPYPPGGSSDIIARAISQPLSEALKQPVIVENRAGATGMIAAEYVAKQPADGTALLMAHINSHAIAPALYPKIPYNAERDFSPITLVGVTPNLLICGEQ